MSKLINIVLLLALAVVVDHIAFDGDYTEKVVTYFKRIS